VGVTLVLALLAALFLLAPILIVVPMSFSTAISFQFPPPAYWLGYYRKFFTSEEWLEPALNSLIIASGAMALTLAQGVPAAFGYVPYRFRRKQRSTSSSWRPLIILRGERARLRVPRPRQTTGTLPGRDHRPRRPQPCPWPASSSRPRSRASTGTSSGRP
jgi:hypothetical protein